MVVSAFDPKNIPEESFGGEERMMRGYEYSKEKFEKIRNAYLLFYRRVKFFDDSGKIVQNAAQSDVAKLPQEASVQILAKIKEDNMKFIASKNLLDPSLQEFCKIQSQRLAKEMELSNVYSPNQEKLFKFICLYFHTVLIRASDRSTVLPIYILNLKSVFSKNIDLSKWFLTQFYNDEVLKEFLLDCPIKDMKYVVAGLLKCAIDSVAKEEQCYDLESMKSKGCIFKMVQVLLTLLRFGGEKKKYDQIARILLVCERSFKAIKEYFLAEKMISKLIILISENATNPILPAYKEFEQYKLTGQPSDFISEKKEAIQENKYDSFQKDFETYGYSSLVIIVCDLVLCVNFTVEIKSLWQCNEFSHNLDEKERESLYLQNNWRRLLFEAQSRTS